MIASSNLRRCLCRSRGLLVLCLAFLSLIPAPPWIQAAGLPTQASPAGTFHSRIDRGGRINTFHRGYLFLGASGGPSSVWDISNPAAPVKRWEGGGNENGHRWYKIGDMYFREYQNPELKSTNYRYLDLSTLPNPTPWTRNPSPMPILKGDVIQDIHEFPYRYAGWGNELWDPRTRTLLSKPSVNMEKAKGIASENTVVFGNLYFWFPAVNGGGVACFDVSDPNNVVFTDVLSGQIFQYPTAVQFWRNYMVLLNGSTSNGGQYNMIAIDISNPYDLRLVWGAPQSAVGGRYAFFQDEFMFTSGGGRVTKYNMATRSVVAQFNPPSGWLLPDFQPIPLGHLVAVSGTETSGGNTILLSHMAGLDTKGPLVGHHWPPANAVNRPLRTYPAVIINETLDDTTINDQTFSVRPVGGAPIAGDVLSTSYNILNFGCKSLLQPNTTYEVRINGIKDVAGNTVTPFTYYFSTGSSIQTQVNTPPEYTGITTSPASPVLRGTTVTFTGSASDTNGDPLEFRWDFADGNGYTAWSTSHVAAKTFPGAGNFTVVSQVRDGRGGQATRSTTLVVNNPPPPAQPSRSAPIVVHTPSRKVWVVNPDNDSVSAIHADTLAKLHEVNVGRDPVGVAVDNQNNVWVVCRDDDTVHVLDGSSGALRNIVTLDHGAKPEAIVFSPDGATGYLSELGRGRITRVSASSRQATGSLAVGPMPRALAITPDGSRLFVTRFVSADNAGSVYNVALPGFTAGSAVTLAMDTTSIDTATTGRGLPNYLQAIAISPTSNRAWIGAKKDNILRGLARNGEAPTFETTFRALIAPINTGTGAEVASERIDIDNHELPSGLAFSPLGSHLFATLQGNNELIVFDPLTRGQVLVVPVGLAPQGVAIDPTTRRVFVHNFMSRDVTVLDGAPMLDSAAFTLPVINTVRTITTEKLSATVLRGKQVFYNAADERMGTDGYMSCAACHLDGGSDGRVWDFTNRGEGLRRTLPLRGRRGTGAGNVHWTGNFDEIQDFENDIRGHFGGRGFLTDAQFNSGTRSQPLGDKKAGLSADLDALAAYVASLDAVGRSPYRNANGTLTSDGTAGKTLFAQLGCNVCHGGADFTDRSLGFLHDVGSIKPASGKRLGETLTGFGTPTLKGLWEHESYLHDGSAATLLDVLTTQNAQSRHGTIATLTTAQRNQLVAYLRQIDEGEGATATSLVGITATDAQASEVGPSAGIFTVTRTVPFTGAIAVPFTVSGTASSADYQSIGGSVTIAAGQASATIVITPVSDGVSEADESVTLTLGAGGGGLPAVGKSATLIISDRDNDPQTPFGGNAPAVPGRIQAENFDIGGQGIAYLDTTLANDGAQYRTGDAVDIEATTDAGGGFNVGWVSAGEWLEFTVNVVDSGPHTLRVRVARQPTGASSLRVLANGIFLADVSVPSTGGWQTWTTLSVAGVNLTAGRQVIRIEALADSWNLNWIEFEATAPPPPPAGAADLVVSDISWTPSSPQAGQAVTFSAVVRNQGSVASPGGTVIGVGFFVDGTFVTWGVDDASGLAAGASRTIVGNGPNPFTWNAASGSHTILAHGDDVDRVAESDNGNNTRSETLVVAEPPPPPVSGENRVVNGSFEQGGATQTPANWNTWSPNGSGAGGESSDYTETAGGAQAGSLHLTHWSSSAYTVYTFQNVGGIPNGTYRLAAWVRSGSSLGYSSLIAKNYGGAERAIQIQPGLSGWTQIAIDSIQVTNGRLEAGIYTSSAAGGWMYLDNVTLIQQ